MIHRRSSEAYERSAERRRREDSAPRLASEVPRLESLRLEISERRGGGLLAGGAHVRHVVVDRAPALFVFPCSDKGCKDGGHDVTREMMHALRAGTVRFTGRHTCDGHLPGGPCGTVLEYVTTATYRPEPH